MTFYSISTNMTICWLNCTAVIDAMLTLLLLLPGKVNILKAH